MADTSLGDNKGLWKKILIIIIIILIIAIFFISTRDYEKFKILDRTTNEKLGLETETVVAATKECNKITNEGYRAGCYDGISYAVGYNNFENLSEICPKLATPGKCYRGAGRRLGEEFYNNTGYMVDMCERLGQENYVRLCRYNALKSAARMLAHHNKGLEYCETVDEQYRNACYEGMGWGLGRQHYPAGRMDMILNCSSLKDYKRLCYYGLSIAVSEYIAKNPSYVETTNNLLIQAIQQGLTNEKYLNVSAENAGFYAGIKYFQDLETAFTICENRFKGLDKNLKTICYKNVYFGFGYAYYSKLFNKALLK